MRPKQLNQHIQHQPFAGKLIAGGTQGELLHDSFHHLNARRGGVYDTEERGKSGGNRFMREFIRIQHGFIHDHIRFGLYVQLIKEIKMNPQNRASGWGDHLILVVNTGRQEDQLTGFDAIAVPVHRCNGFPWYT